MSDPITASSEIKTIEREELRSKLAAKEPSFKLVMALGDFEFRNKHIPGSLHFRDAAHMLAAVGKDEEVVVYCTNPMCPASVSLYQRLVREGYSNVRRYAGGIEDWENAGLALERGAS
jgi:rhodanese-related sulfurtransferase